MWQGWRGVRVVRGQVWDRRKGSEVEILFFFFFQG